LDREVDHGEESKVEEEISEEESRSSAQKEKNDEVGEEGGAEEEGQEGCPEAQSCRAEAAGCRAEAESRGAKACGQSDAGTRACSSADTGCGYAPVVRRYRQWRYELAPRAIGDAALAVEPALRQTHRNSIEPERVASWCIA